MTQIEPSLYTVMVYRRYPDGARDLVPLVNVTVRLGPGLDETKARLTGALSALAELLHAAA